MKEIIPDSVWERRRARIASEAMAAIINGSYPYPNATPTVAAMAVAYADALIEELKKQPTKTTKQ